MKSIGLARSATLILSDLHHLPSLMSVSLGSSYSSRISGDKNEFTQIKSCSIVVLSENNNGELR